MSRHGLGILCLLGALLSSQAQGGVASAWSSPALSHPVVSPETTRSVPPIFSLSTGFFLEDGRDLSPSGLPCADFVTENCNAGKESASPSPSTGTGDTGRTPAGALLVLQGILVAGLGKRRRKLIACLAVLMYLGRAALATLPVPHAPSARSCTQGASVHQVSQRQTSEAHSPAQRFSAMLRRLQGEPEALLRAAIRNLADHSEGRLRASIPCVHVLPVPFVIPHDLYLHLQVTPRGTSFLSPAFSSYALFPRPPPCRSVSLRLLCPSDN